MTDQENPSPEKVTDAMRAAWAGLDSRVDGWQLHFLESMQSEFDETGDPMLPLNAFLTARRNSIPVPEWVLAYLEGRFQQLNRIAVDGVEGKSRTEAAGETLGFGALGHGKRSTVKKASLDSRNVSIAIMVEYEMRAALDRNEKLGKSKAAEFVAEMMGHDVGTVRAAHKKFEQKAAQVLSGILRSTDTPDPLNIKE